VAALSVAGVLERLRPALGVARRSHGSLIDAHAQLVFSRSPLTGSLLLGVSASQPRLLLGGLLALAAGELLARRFGVSDYEWQRGPYAANLLLLGLGAAQVFAPTPLGAAALILAALLCLLLVSGLRHLEQRSLGLPPLALGFCLTHLLFLSTGRALGLPAAPPLLMPSSLHWGAFEAPLCALGSLLFQPAAPAGAVLLLGLLLHSRISTLCVGLALGGAALWLSRLGPMTAPLAHGLSLNAALTALALGAVWFVPSRRSLTLGLLVSAALLVASSGLALDLQARGITLSILPFHFTFYAALLALRQRAADEAPKSVDFLPGTPEQNLAFHSERTARFPGGIALEITLPFRGTWVCSQGVDGRHTHREVWRHAWDFEVRDARGSFFEGAGSRREDYYCYRLPALAVADGTVASLKGDIADNAIGELNVEDRFGNYVVLQHAPGLYSLLGHLEPGSLRVSLGQRVARGTVVGVVGNSGRSPRPHLHFNLQSGPEPGAATRPCFFGNAVVVEDTQLLFDRTAPITEGMCLRPLSSSDCPTSPLGIRLGERWTFAVDGRDETLHLDLDLLGTKVLVSDRDAQLRVELGPSGYLAHDVSGSADSVLHLLRACLPRLPQDDAAELQFEDFIHDARPRGPVLGWLGGFVDLLRDSVGHRARFIVKRSFGSVVVEGRSAPATGDGTPIVSTRAELGARGLVALELRRGSRVYRAERVLGHAPRSLGCQPATSASLGAK
jgi:murein DD-endopeptidase MepM/ murein hydrolase activator NlpD/urea transporter